jgi:fumarate reductase subunit C
VFSVLVAFVTTIVVLVVLVIGLRSAGTRSPLIAGWISFGASTLAVVAVVVPLVASRLPRDDTYQAGTVVTWLPLLSMTLGLMGLATGVFALVRGERSWRSWVGLVTGALVTLFWLAFAFGDLLFPH